MLGRTVYDNMQENTHMNLELSAPGLSYGDVTEGVGGSRFRGFSAATSALNLAAGNTGTAGLNVFSGYGYGPMAGQIINPFMQMAARKTYGTARGAMAIDYMKGLSDTALNRMGVGLTWEHGSDGLGKLGGLNISVGKQYRQAHLARKSAAAKKFGLSGYVGDAMDFAGSSLGFGATGLGARAASFGAKAAIGGAIASGIGSMLDVENEDMTSVIAAGAVMGGSVDLLGNAGIMAASKLKKKAGEEAAEEALSRAAKRAKEKAAKKAAKKVAKTVGGEAAEEATETVAKGILGKIGKASAAKGIAKIATGALKVSNAIGWVDTAIDIASIGNEVRMSQQMELIKEFPSKQMAMIHNSTNHQNVAEHTNYSMSNEMELNYLLSTTNLARENYNNYSNY